MPEDIPIGAANLKNCCKRTPYHGGFPKWCFTYGSELVKRPNRLQHHGPDMHLNHTHLPRFLDNRGKTRQILPLWPPPPSSSLPPLPCAWQLLRRGPFQPPPSSSPPPASWPLPLASSFPPLPCAWTLPLREPSRLPPSVWQLPRPALFAWPSRLRQG